MNNSHISADDLQRLPQSWFDLAAKNANETEKEKLYEMTTSAVLYLGRSVNENPKETLKICNNLVTQFNAAVANTKDHGQGLSSWIAKNEGAYSSIHELFNTISKIIDKPFNPGNIDTESLKNIVLIEKRLPKDTLDLINFYSLNNANIDDMVSLCNTKEGKEFAMPFLINFVNKGGITLHQLNFKLDFKTIDGIIEFLGDDCKKITRFECSNIKDRDLEKICNSFPNIDTIILPRCRANVSAYLGKMTELKSFCISSEQIQDLSFLEDLPHFETLLLAGCNLKDASFLKNLTGLTKLALKHENHIQDYNTLVNLPNLKYIDLSFNEIEDFSFLLKCPNLAEVRRLSISFGDDKSNFHDVRENLEAKKVNVNPNASQFI